MSLENLLLKAVRPLNWDGVYPHQDSNTLFRMYDFSTVSDIVDKGPNKIAVTKNGTFTTGVNSSYGPYTRMNTGNFLSWSSALLNAQSLDITMIIGNFTFSLSSSPALVDCRPTSTNGNYFVVSGKGSAPFATSFYFNSVQSPSSTTLDTSSFPVVLVFKLRPNVQEVWANGLKILSWSGNFTYAANQNYKIGRHAFAGSANIPNLQADLYYFDIKKV